MRLNARSPYGPIRDVSGAVLSHLLSSSVLFEHDATEIGFWLQSLPRLERSSNAEAPDGTKLSNDVDGVVALLEECIQRCLKTPYKYVEESIAVTRLLAESPQDEDSSQPSYSTTSVPSPLLFALLEQFKTKISMAIMPSSDALSTITYLRKLTLALTGKQPDLKYARHISASLDQALNLSSQAQVGQLLYAAITRELQVLHHCLHFLPLVLEDRNRVGTSAKGVLQDLEAMSDGQSSLSIIQDLISLL